MTIDIILLCCIAALVGNLIGFFVGYFKGNKVSHHTSDLKYSFNAKFKHVENQIKFLECQLDGGHDLFCKEMHTKIDDINFKNENRVVCLQCKKCLKTVKKYYEDLTDEERKIVNNIKED